MAAAGTPEGGRTGPPDLRRVATDLDHIRCLGGLAPARLESLRIAAAELRAQATVQDLRHAVFPIRTRRRRAPKLLTIGDPER